MTTKRRSSGESSFPVRRLRRVPVPAAATQAAVRPPLNRRSRQPLPPRRPPFPRGPCPYIACPARAAVTCRASPSRAARRSLPPAAVACSPQGTSPQSTMLSTRAHPSAMNACPACAQSDHEDRHLRGKPAPHRHRRQGRSLHRGAGHHRAAAGRDRSAEETVPQAAGCQASPRGGRARA